jgi:hypothetical protein
MYDNINYIYLLNFQGHSGPGGLALAYLNEYSIVSAAFTLHSSEIKIIKVR